MSDAAPPSAAETFVRRLLATDDAERRRALIARHRLPPEEGRDALRRLDDEAVRLHGVDPRRMERACIDALALAELTDDQFMWATVRMHQGDALRAQDQNAAALDLYDGAWRVFTALGYPVEAARTRIGWIWAAAGLGRYSHAIGEARKARRIFMTHGEMYRVAGLDLNTGNIFRRQGRYSAAYRWDSRALEIYASIAEEGRRDVALSMAWCHANRGLALTHLGRHGEALTEVETARSTFVRLGEKVSAARAVLNFGQIQMELGRYAAALRAFEEARQTCRELGLENEATGATQALVDCYLLLDRPEDALDALQAASHAPDGTDSVQLVSALAIREVTALLRLSRREEALAVLDIAEQRATASSLQDQGWLAT